MNINTYFHLYHDGVPMERHEVNTRSGFSIDLYECQVCAALVSDVHTHAGYHEDKGE